MPISRSNTRRQSMRRMSSFSQSSGRFANSSLKRRPLRKDPTFFGFVAKCFWIMMFIGVTFISFDKLSKLLIQIF
ncbi:Oidioi.mRNA.OKI2018_I69.PAR.g11802.t3.cds [Oikopleura dioica]|uniref:Oidioi.mRNA.OKI2018_I69.PAR.g11802.t3.cds n=1 Tax=Oikopleura dioica TaxID=34765 RepID=A0ABN7RXE9_OIKDI|nr:Oidioi.mRNA.OKI2018_I69.PAR.g11802.t3.cds [Oikopleura dioica]